MNRNLRFGIIGCGVIAPTHARSLSELPDAEVAGVCDIIQERARHLARTYGGEVYTDFQRMLEQADLDAVCVCTPSGLHADIGMAAARAGKHVLVEKPIDINLEKADALIHTCRESRVKLGTIFQHRFDPAVVDLHDAVRAQKLGQLIFGGAYTQWYRTQEYYGSGDWRGTWALEGGGALINQSIHYIDLLLYIFGAVDEIHAYSGTFAHKNIEVEDTAVASLRFKSGALGVIEGMTSAYPGFNSRLEVFGQDGGVMIEDDIIKDWRLRSGEAYIASPSAGSSIAGSSSLNIWHHGHRRQIADFVRSIRTDQEPLVNGEEGRKSLEVVLAMYQSAREQRTIRLGQPSAPI